MKNTAINRSIFHQLSNNNFPISKAFSWL